MKFFIKHREQIIISLIVGVLLVLMTPIIMQIPNYAVKCFVYLNEAFSNFFYRLVAKNDLNAFAKQANYIAILFMFFMFGFLISHLNDYRRNFNDYRKKGLTIINDFNDATEELNKKEVIDIINEYKNDYNLLNNIIISWNWKVIVFFITILYFMTLLAGSYSLNNVANSKNVDFRNNLIKIKPFANETIIHQIEADWASIENKKDYDRIISIINEIKEKNRIK